MKQSLNILPTLHIEERLLNKIKYKKYVRKIAVSMKYVNMADFNVFTALYSKNRLISENVYKLYKVKLGEHAYNSKE